jgi:hypothetical protein
MKTLKIIAGSIVAFFFLLLVITFTLDGMIKSGIEENGSELLQTQVTVDKVNISVFNGRGTINGFTVKNPENYSDETALYFQEASIKVDISSLLSDQIVVNEIIVNSPEILFEQKGLGINLKTLSDNMDQGYEVSSENSDTNLVIEHLVVNNGKVLVSSSLGRERKTEVTLSEFTLNDVGRDENNTVKKSVQEVLKPLFQKAMQEAMKSGVTEQLEDKVRNLFDN